MPPLYHGTSKRHARSILRHGLRDSTWMEHQAIPGKSHRLRYRGALGHGTYLTANWKVGLFFGPVLFRAELQPGTRIVHLDVPHDSAIISRLQRKFTHQLLTHPLHQSIPRNKRLTLDEAIQLARYHHHACGKNLFSSPKHQIHHQRLLELRSVLISYGIHGWGEMHDLYGLCLFAPSRIHLREVVLCLPTARLAADCNNYLRTGGPHASLDAMIQTMHRASTPAAHNTRHFFHQANLSLSANKNS
jgi:hypothetical protein